MLRDVLMRVLFLRQSRGTAARIVVYRVDVKDAFQQVPVDAGFALVVVAPSRGGPVVPLPRNIRLCLARGEIPGAGGLDSITSTTASLLSFNGGRTAAVASEWCSRSPRTTFACWAKVEYTRYDLPLISDLQITNWDTRLEVLGWIIDTETLTMTLPPHERGKLFERLAAWSASRASVSAKQVSKLVGFLMHISFAIRPGLFFVQRMLASVGMLPITAGADFAGRTANPGPRVVLGSKVHRDLDFGVSSLLRGSTRGGGCLPDPIYHLLERPARCALFSDAFKTAIGAFASKLECTAAMS